ncbi:MAG: hypothetical protein RL417_2056 [Pseudomonadota bacterium]|jgi:hypothetical protein
MSVDVDTALSDRVRHVVASIKTWDRHDIMELHGLLMELKKIVALFDQDPGWYITRTQVPAMPLPAGVPEESIWGCDMNGVCLVKRDDEFSFKARAVADLAPGVVFDTERGLNPREILVGVGRKKRISVQLPHREYAAMLRAMRQDEEVKVASWVRNLIVKELKGRKIE